MILSHKLGIVFIKGRKVAGTSVEMALSSVCGPQDIITPITPRDELLRMNLGYRAAQNYSADPQGERDYLEILRQTNEALLASVPLPVGNFYNHMPLTEVIAKAGRALDGYIIACLVRSPYQKVLSWANMKLMFSQYKSGQNMQADLAAVKKKLADALKGDDFVLVKDIQAYYAVDGRLGVDTILRYETLQEDFNKLMQRVGVVPPPPLPHAKKGISADSVDLREVFEPWQLEKINTLFKEEFEAFGYEMIK